MNSVGWILAFAAVLAPFVMHVIFLVTAILLWLKVRTTPTAVLALGAVLGTIGHFVLRAAGPPLSSYKGIVHAIASILQAVGFLWFVLALLKRQAPLTTIAAHAQKAARRST